MESIKEVIASIEGRMAWAQKESANAESRQAEIDAKIADMKAQLHKASNTCTTPCLGSCSLIAANLVFHGIRIFLHLWGWYWT